MYIKLGLQMFVKNIVLNLVVVLQLAVTLLLSNILVSDINQYSQVLRIMESFPAEDVSLFMPRAHNDDVEERAGRLREILTAYKDELLVEPVVGGFFPTASGDEMRVLGYGSETARYLHMPLKRGQWFAGEAGSVDGIPCVASGDFQPGDTLTLIMQDADGGEREVLFKVTGVLRDSGFIYDFSTISNSPMLEMLFSRIERINTQPLLLFEQSALKAELPPFSDGNALAYFRTDATEVRAHITEELQANAWFVPFKDARAESMSEFFLRIKSMLPLIVVVFFMGLISVLCLTVLNVVRHRRMFSIYYICGMRWQGCLLICAGYTVCQLLGAGLVSLLLSLVAGFGGYLPLEDLLLGGLNIAVTLIIIVLTLSAALITPCLLLRKEPPLQSLIESR